MIIRMELSEADIVRAIKKYIADNWGEGIPIARGISVEIKTVSDFSNELQANCSFEYQK